MVLKPLSHKEKRGRNTKRAAYLISGRCERRKDLIAVEEKRNGREVLVKNVKCAHPKKNRAES